MGVFGALLVGLIHLAVVGLDIVAFFVIVQMIASRWPVRFLVTLGHIGRPVTDQLVRATARALSWNQHEMTQRREMIGCAITLAVLALCRLALGGMYRSIV